jgi:hypothetical protein
VTIKPAAGIMKVQDDVQVDAAHGIVFGFAIVSKIKNAAGAYEDYYDLNIDTEGVHKGKPVPEAITDDAILKAVVEASAAGTHMVGDEMHAGPDTGSYPFMFPLTEDIAKALGIDAPKLGLLVGYHPEAAVLKKFEDGTYTGFSMTGGRVAYEEEEA